MAYLTAALALILALLGGYWWTDTTAFQRGYDDRDGKCMAERLELENSRLEAERQARAEREKGRILADRAAERVAKLQADMAVNTERFNRELAKRASASRMCFRAPVASLLQRADPVVPATGGDAPSASAARAAPDSAPAAPAAERPDADEAGTSEHAAAAYIDLIKARFNACRAQLREVIVSTQNDPID